MVLLLSKYIKVYRREDGKTSLLEKHVINDCLSNRPDLHL